MDPFSAEGIRGRLDTHFVGQNLVYLPEIGSTNDAAKRLANEGAPEGTLVIADYQTAGRGRLDRRWVAPPGSSLLMSLLFRPTLAPQRIQRLTMICGLAVTDAIEAETRLRAGLKWPNDIVVNGAKVGGILTESGFRGKQVEWVIVGIGLNVNLDLGQLSDSLLMQATSLAQASGTMVSRLSLLLAFLRALERRYKALQAGQSPHAEWAAELVTIGQVVTASSQQGTVEGVAEGVNSDGALLVRLADTSLRTIVAGDVTLRKVDR